MRVVIDPKAGFCPGVKQAIHLAETYLEKNHRLFALGELIHNRIENKRLQKKGLRIVNHAIFEEEKFSDSSPELLIRAHGEPPETFSRIEASGFKLIDATCPIVRRSQKIATEYFRKGYQVVIVGKPGHPEVIGIMGYCENQARVVYEEEDLAALDKEEKTFVLAQTTISGSHFNKMLKFMRQMGMKITVKKSICRFVANRQQEAQEFARKFAVVLVAGGKNSSNTGVLFESCKQVNPNVFWVEAPEEIQQIWFREKDSVGITGGASAPCWLMKEMKRKILNNFYPGDSA